VDFASCLEQRREETKALDVIGVEVGEQDVDSAAVDQGRAQPPDARAGIENQDGAVG
jgi:hypothetical protein